MERVEVDWSADTWDELFENVKNLIKTKFPDIKPKNVETVTLDGGNVLELKVVEQLR